MVTNRPGEMLEEGTNVAAVGIMKARHRNPRPVASRADDPVAPRVRSIPREAWREFLDEFSRTHEEWLVDVSTFEPDRGVQLIVHDRPLRGITLDGDRIAIGLDGGAETHLTHVIEHPDALNVELEDDHVERSLAIKSGAARLEIRFRSALSPEMVDGVP